MATNFAQSLISNIMAVTSPGREAAASTQRGGETIAALSAQQGDFLGRGIRTAGQDVGQALQSISAIAHEYAPDAERLYLARQAAEYDPSFAPAVNKLEKLLQARVAVKEAKRAGVSKAEIGQAQEAYRQSVAEYEKEAARLNRREERLKRRQERLAGEAPPAVEEAPAIEKPPEKKKRDFLTSFEKKFKDFQKEQEKLKKEKQAIEAKKPTGDEIVYSSARQKRIADRQKEIAERQAALGEAPEPTGLAAVPPEAAPLAPQEARKLTRQIRREINEILPGKSALRGIIQMEASRGAGYKLSLKDQLAYDKFAAERADKLMAQNLDKAQDVFEKMKPTQALKKAYKNALFHLSQGLMTKYQMHPGGPLGMSAEAANAMNKVNSLVLDPTANTRTVASEYDNQNNRYSNNVDEILTDKDLSAFGKTARVLMESSLSKEYVIYDDHGNVSKVVGNRLTEDILRNLVDRRGRPIVDPTTLAYFLGVLVDRSVADLQKDKTLKKKLASSKDTFKINISKKLKALQDAGFDFVGDVGAVDIDENTDKVMVDTLLDEDLGAFAPRVYQQYKQAIKTQKGDQWEWLRLAAYLFGAVRDMRYFREGNEKLLADEIKNNLAYERIRTDKGEFTQEFKDALKNARDNIKQLIKKSPAASYQDFKARGIRDYR